MKPHLRKYLAWLEMQVAHRSKGNASSSYNLCGIDLDDKLAMEALICRIKSFNAEGKLFVEVGQNLPAIFRDEIDPLEVAFHNGLAEKHYAEACEKITCRPQLQTYLSALAHKQPGLKILEIGAGTGSLTHYILDVFSRTNASDLDEGLAQYDYTDISKTFFEPASERFANFKSKMNFMSLDIDRDPIEQGFEAESYDVIVAAWVLHATRDLSATVSNTRKLLKPGGKLVLAEITEPDMLRNGFVFGTLPGWWLGEEPNRKWSPCLSEDDWDDVLKRNGFSGVDIFLPDYQDSICHENSIMITSANTENSITLQPSFSEHQIVLIIGLDSPVQYQAQVELAKSLRCGLNACCSIITTSEIDQADVTPSTILIFLVELDRPYLRNLDAAGFTTLQRLLTSSRTVFWVTGAATTTTPHYADAHMASGLARVMCTERTNLTFVTLALEDHASQPQEWARRIRQVYESTRRDPYGTCELEYMERDGVLLINRVSKSPRLNREIHRRNHATLSETPWTNSLPLRLTVPNPGFLDTLRFEEDTSIHGELDPEEIEIQVHAVGINFRDLLVALGRLPANTVGCECAGVVTRVGSACSAFQPGQRVCAVIMGCMKSFARCNHLAAVAIPDAMSFAEAASVPVTGATAYHALVHVADIQPGETVLIHSAAGGTGQMAVQVALFRKADVFVTVGTEEKKRFLQDEYGIAEERIFGSRDNSFAREVLRATNGRGVDVVLNSLSGEALIASWEIIAPYGRFVEIGRAEIEGNAKLPMSHFAKNVSFSAVALDHMAEHRPRAVGTALLAVMKLISAGTMRIACPLVEYPISELEDALRTIQTGKSIGKIVLTMADVDRVDTYLNYTPTWSLDSSATYLIAGGLGGLGRSAARWMSRRGAKNLILLSRSGPKSRAAQQLLCELSSSGVRVATPKCDVSSQDSLRETLKQCSDLPPIKGCLQATMVLQDALFETMTFEQWSKSLTSKVESTWNLHALLPADLSFFIMLSSVAGVAGSLGQSNYAAGNTYQDALAKQRLAMGRHAVSIDLGWMGDVGIIAENADLARGKEEAADLAQIFENEFLAVLDYYSDPNHEFHDLEESQPILGLVTAEQFRSKGISPPKWLHDRPVFRPLTLATSENDHSGISGGPEDRGVRDQDFAAEYIHAESEVDRVSVVTEALVHKLSRALSMPIGEIDLSRPLHVLGVDSLLAVELRNWFASVFKADVAIFDITGQEALENLAKGAVKKSELKKSH